jgi:adenine-specific DNA-methyltransferase
MAEEQPQLDPAPHRPAVPPERYAFTWAGRREAVALAATPCRARLALEPEECVGSAPSRNLFIEGDNLDALKLLCAEYAGRVKTIYIDPPYNTGNDFIYPDRYAHPLHAYLRLTGQRAPGGDSPEAATETRGRRHAAWLSMMYPRLALARTLLREDGVLFVSIDDHEAHHLRLLLDDIFGEEHFIATLPWKGRGGRQASAHLAVHHEYVLLYARDRAAFVPGGMPRLGGAYPRRDPQSGRRYQRRLARKWGSSSRRQDRPHLFYPITAPDGSTVYPHLASGEDGRWRWSEERMRREQAAGHVEFVRDGGGWQVYEKVYKPPAGETAYQKFTTWLDDVGSTASGTDDLQALFDGAAPFDYPKPVALIRRLLQIAGTGGPEETLILDFFAGSGTTAQAVLEQNRADGGRRRFLLVQAPEPTRDSRYPTIAAIARERIRRVLIRHARDGAAGANEDLGLRALRVERLADG